MYKKLSLGLLLTKSTLPRRHHRRRHTRKPAFGGSMPSLLRSLIEAHALEMEHAGHDWQLGFYQITPLAPIVEDHLQRPRRPPPLLPTHPACLESHASLSRYRSTSSGVA